MAIFVFSVIAVHSLTSRGTGKAAEVRPCGGIRCRRWRAREIFVPPRRPTSYAHPVTRRATDRGIYQTFILRWCYLHLRWSKVHSRQSYLHLAITGPPFAMKLYINLVYQSDLHTSIHRPQPARRVVNDFWLITLHSRTHLEDDLVRGVAQFLKLVTNNSVSPRRLSLYACHLSLAAP